MDYVALRYVQSLVRSRPLNRFQLEESLAARFSWESGKAHRVITEMIDRKYIDRDQDNFFRWQR